MDSRQVTVSTCGISMFSNRWATDDPHIASFVKKNSTKTEKDLAADTETLKRLEDWTTDVGRRLMAADIKEVSCASAELNAWLHIYDYNTDAARKDNHYFIHTDTYLGKRAAEVVRDWLTGRGVEKCSLYSASDLNARDTSEFHWGMAELLKHCQQSFAPYRNDPNVRLIISPVGGFKAVQAYMTVFGMLYADEVVYIYEGSSGLIRIPRLPLRLDVETLDAHHAVLRRMDVGAKVGADEVKELPEILIHADEDQATLSEWGVLLWGERKEQLYGMRLLDSPTDKIVYGPKFAASLTSDRLRDINQTVDDVMRKLLTGKQLRRSRMESLQGDPVRGSTYEIYAWSDQDARRIYCHYDGDRLVLDRLDEHLR